MDTCMNNSSLLVLNSNMLGPGHTIFANPCRKEDECIMMIVF